MKNLIFTFLIFTSFNLFPQGELMAVVKGNTSVNVNNVNQLTINELLNKKIFKYNKSRNPFKICGVSLIDTAGLLTAKERCIAMGKRRRIGHILPRIYSEFNSNKNREEIAENVMFTNEFVGGKFTYNDLVNKIFKTYITSKLGHKETIQIAYSEKDYTIFISTYVKMSKSGSFYSSLVITSE